MIGSNYTAAAQCSHVVVLTVNEVFFNNDSSSFKVCDDTGEDNSCSNSVAWDDVLFVSDHMVYMGHIITHCKS